MRFASATWPYYVDLKESTQLFNFDWLSIFA